MSDPSDAPACNACGAPAVVQWRRRPTATELAAIVAAAEERRAEIIALADQQQPPPVFGPLPTAADTVIAVFACAEHAITLDAATQVHEATCTVDADRAPECPCTPEPPPAPEPRPRTVTLPTGWQITT